MPRYELSSLAEHDLTEVALYTRKTWGEAQSLHYAKLLEACFERIASGEQHVRAVSRSLPDVFTCRCEHHYVFYIEGKVPYIIAVLHEKMDMLQRLKRRLPEE